MGVFGGRSGEDEGSLASARAIKQALGEKGRYVVFPVLHGPYGEDGTIQGMLELAGVPYVGSGVLGSAAGMDKPTMKKIFAHHDLPQVEWVAFTRNQWEKNRESLTEEIEGLGYPCFVKPANLGSSVGIRKAENAE